MILFLYFATLSVLFLAAVVLTLAASIWDPYVGCAVGGLLGLVYGAAIVPRAAKWFVAIEIKRQSRRTNRRPL